MPPFNDSLDRMEFYWSEQMEEFYKKHSLKKAGQGPGGKFNGKDIRLIFQDSNLEQLRSMLPVEAEPFLNYLRSIRELHFAVISKEFSYSRCEKAIFEFEIHFWHLHETMSLPMTLKVHIILDHYMWYFNEMGKNFCETNGEFVEAVHYTLDGHEDKHKFKVTRNIGTDEYLRKAIQSHTSFNSLRVGSPNQIMSIKKKSPNSPLARPN